MTSTKIRTDWQLYTAAMLILLFGLVMVYSSSSVVAEVHYHKEHWEFAAKQLGFALFGIASMILLKRLDYKKLQHPIWILAPMGVTIMLLIGVIAADPRAHRWYRIPSVGQFQPSELAKPVLILFLAWFVARREANLNDKYTLRPTALVVGVLTLLVGFGDLGTAAVLLAPAVVIFYVAGIERKYFYLALGLAALLGIGFILQKPYRLFRVLAFVGITEKTVNEHPKLHWVAEQMASSRAARDAGHQATQGKIAVGSGGWTGVGLGLSDQKLGFLPEAHTDFIFGIVGEETGLVGCVLLLSGYMFIFWRGIRLYWTTQDAFGRYIALGCVAVITTQALFNMSVVLDMAPTKGIPLPLISFGGSALICTLSTLGLLMSVSDRAS
ncbi:MAG: FtsW/RodA/SpoVE family cell cycle protein [Bryobacterales bacterium]|nr:FtsW/RodA/SpoVE family cell cycle protein [Bryobacterales bacterium]